MKIYKIFEDFVRNENISKGWDDYPAIAIFIDKNNKNLNYGQTGSWFETNRGAYFFIPDKDSMTKTIVYEVTRKQIKIIKKWLT